MIERPLAQHGAIWLDRTQGTESFGELAAGVNENATAIPSAPAAGIVAFDAQDHQGRPRLDQAQTLHGGPQELALCARSQELRLLMLPARHSRLSVAHTAAAPTARAWLRPVAAAAVWARQWVRFAVERGRAESPGAADHQAEHLVGAGHLMGCPDAAP